MPVHNSRPSLSNSENNKIFDAQNRPINDRSENVKKKQKHITAKMHSVLRTYGDLGRVKIAVSICTIHDSQML